MTTIDTSTYSNGGSTGFYDQVGDVVTAFENINTALDGATASVTDPEYGMIAGLNCLIIG